MANNIYEHNVGAVCGFHWQGNSSRCGTPNGYMVVDVDGDNILWHFKPTGHDLSYQFKIYKPGEFSSQTEYIVANVWDWDNTYKINWYEDGILKGSMEQFSDIDQDFIDSGRVKVYRTDHLFRAKPSSTAKEIKIEVINRFGETYTKTIELLINTK
ncbi:MAG: calcineurin-like phosphoesterase C-terminal domain-containing protein [Coprobacter sp.]